MCPIWDPTDSSQKQPALMSVDDLIAAYVTIAGLNRQFHWACEHGTLPMRPLCGTA